jgi:undecaprenyl-diphosphatase
MSTSLLARLDARDRALFLRWTVTPSTSSVRAWIALTHMGGLWGTMAAAGLPLLASGPLRLAALHAAAGLVLSHAVVQLIKRNVLRERPALAVGTEALITSPDAFSFPSGHATAAMAVAFMYALAFPGWAAPLIMIAVVVGISRVCLGVHFPGDVLAGQAIAIVTDLCVVNYWG